MMRPRIRVLQLTDSFKVGGAERVVLLLARHIDREHFEVMPCALRETGPLEDEMRAAGISYRVLGIPRWSILTGPLFAANLQYTVQALAKTVRDLSIDIIHAHLTETTLLGILAARRVGSVRVCGTAHSVVLSSKRGRLSPRDWLVGATMGKMFTHADRIIAVSASVARAIQVRTGISPEQVVTIPNGVESNGALRRTSRSALREMLSIPKERLVAVSVGRLSAEKGFPDLLDALVLIPADQRPLTLIVGDGPKRMELEARTQLMGLDQDVRFLGHRHDVPAVLAASDLFVLASHWEGLPLGLLEAMAAGLPAIVTEVGGNPEAIVDGATGLLVPPRHKQAFATAISCLLRDPLRRDQMGKAALKRFDRHFSIHTFIGAHQSLYEGMLSGSLPVRPISL